jgi:hypothetical protein
MKELFEVAAGTVVGRHHVRLGVNNQDGYYLTSTEEATIAIVCDGCSSGVHSEVGAKVGARLVGEAIRRSLFEGEAIVEPEKCLELVRQNVLENIKTMAIAMGGNTNEIPPKILQHYFLFTIVGVWIARSGIVTFSLGDGLLIVNDRPTQIGPFANNAPPYLVYDFLDSNSDRWKFTIHDRLNLEDLNSILIGTDGVNDLMKLAHCPFPGKPDLIGDIRQFWTQDRYFQNPDTIRRQLSLINREIHKPNWEHRQMLKETGLLPDDTTLIVIRKRKSS